MTNKIKLIFPVLALGILISGTAFAAETTPRKEGLKEITTGTTIPVSVKNNTTTQNTKSVCITNAKTTKASAVKAANDTAKQAKLNAKTAKDASIKEAKANANKKAGLAQIRTANAIYKKSIKDANTSQISAIKLTITTYKNNIKTCPIK